MTITQPTQPTQPTNGATLPEEPTTAVTAPQPGQAQQGYYPGYGAPQQGPGYGAPQAPGYGPGFPPSYGPQHTATGLPGGPKRGLAAVPRAAWLAAAGALALVVILVAVVVAGHSGSGSTASSSVRSYAPTTAASDKPEGDPGKLITSAQLPGMLLSPAEIAEAVGQPGNVEGAKASKVYTSAFVDTLTSGQECLPLAYAAEQVAFQGTGFTAMRSQNTQVRVPNDDARSWSLTQGVFAYPSRDAAEKALLTNIGTWKTCEGKSWSYQVDNGNGPATYFWTVGSVQQIDTLVIAPLTQENGDGWGCWRGITVTGNVVADFTACGKDFTPTVATNAAAAIVGKAPSA